MITFILSFGEGLSWFTKMIILPIKEPPKKIEPKEKKKRVVIKESSWVFDVPDYQPQTQRNILYDNPNSAHFKKLNKFNYSYCDYFT